MRNLSTNFGLYPVTMTRFPFPLTEDISKVAEDEGSEQGKIWIEGTKALTMAPDHKVSVLARVKENPSEVLLITTWETTSALQAFQSSPNYSLYLAALSMHGPPSSPQTVHFQSRRGRQYGPAMNDNISIRTIYFPLALTPEQKEFAFNVTAFFDYSSGRPNTGVGRALLGHWWSSWIEGEVEFQGEKAKGMIVVHWWNGWEMMEAYLEQRSPVWEGEMFDQGVLVDTEIVGSATNVEKWDRRLKENGALGWKDETCELKICPMGLWWIEWSWMQRQSRSYEAVC